MTYHVRTLRQARLDIQGILDWFSVEKESLFGAARWIDAYENAVEALRHDPESYAPAQEEGSVTYELRQFLIKTRRGRTYRGVFTIVGDEVRILRVRGPGQAPLQPKDLQQ